MQETPVGVGYVPQEIRFRTNIRMVKCIWRVQIFNNPNFALFIVQASNVSTIVPTERRR